MNDGMIRFRGTLVAEAPISVSYSGMDGVLPRTPHGEAYLNGGTLRGPLRKAALRAVRRVIAERDGVPEQGLLTLTDAYMLGTGVDRTRQVNNEKDAGIDPLAEQHLRELNPLLSLFGRWNLPSRLEVSEMRTPAENLVVSGQGVRHNPFARDPQEAEYLSEADRQALMEEIRAERESSKELGYTDLMVDGAPSPHQSDTTLRWLIDRLRS